MNVPWRRKTLLKGDDLYEEAERLGVSLSDLPYPFTRGASGSGDKNPQNEPELQSRVLAARADRRNATINWAQTIGIIGTLVVTIFFSLSNRRDQERDLLGQEKRFAAAQRASIYVGRPDGKTAEFVGSSVKGGWDEVVVFLRNYGQTTAENTIIEIWPLVFIANQPAAFLTIPPFQRFSRMSRMSGDLMPPGLLTVKVAPIPPLEREWVEDGKAGLTIEGRISYTDQFGQYCQPFAIEYQRGITEGFFLASNPSQSICDGKPHQIWYKMSSFGRQTPNLGYRMPP
jgi:hypothetical protein